MTSLPTTRRLLTSILNSLTLPPSISTQETDAPHDPPSNPLKRLSAAQHALLMSLHVLFPPPTLLQALDLLDRGLVTRVVLQNPYLPRHCAGSNDGLEGAVVPPQANMYVPTSSASGQGKRKEKERGNRVYQVRSSQAPKGRFKDIGSTAMVYTVRLEAWNCSCAAFAFAAFPGGWGEAWLEENEDDGMEIGDGEMEEEEAWEFGGMSRDRGNVPVCKHLLACLLGERWEEILGIYVKEKEVGREEMAGVGGEG